MLLLIRAILLRRAWRKALSDSAVQLVFPYWLTPAQRAWFVGATVGVRRVRFADPADQLCDPSACGAVQALAARQPDVLPMLTVWLTFWSFSPLLSTLSVPCSQRSYRL